MNVIQEIEQQFAKKHVVDVRSGDTVRVHQKIREGNKERTQVFEGLVIRTKNTGSLSSTITVRRIASGVGVEKTFLLHSPLIVKVEVTKRSQVRRNYLSYMRARSGKSARLASISFDRNAVNAVPDPEERDEAAPTEAAGEEPVADKAEQAAATEPAANEEPTDATPSDDSTEVAETPKAESTKE